MIKPDGVQVGTLALPLCARGLRTTDLVALAAS